MLSELIKPRLILACLLLGLGITAAGACQDGQAK